MNPGAFARLSQITDSHCGPAVMQMLLDFYHIAVSQDQIVAAAGAQSTIIERGMRLDQFAQIVERLAPGYRLWYKEDASVADLQALVETHGLPVGVNWQGFFNDTLWEEKRDNPYLTHGHYGVVVRIDAQGDTLTLADPYSEFTGRDRTLPLDWFKTRWWDVDDGPDPDTGKQICYYTSRLLFAVIPATDTFHAQLQLALVAPDYLERKLARARLSYSQHPPIGSERPHDAVGH